MDVGTASSIATICGAVISLAAAGFAFWQVGLAKTQVKHAKESASSAEDQAIQAKRAADAVATATGLEVQRNLLLMANAIRSTQSLCSQGVYIAKQPGPADIANIKGEIRAGIERIRAVPRDVSPMFETGLKAFLDNALRLEPILSLGKDINVPYFGPNQSISDLLMEMHFQSDELARSLENEANALRRGG